MMKVTPVVRNTMERALPVALKGNVSSRRFVKGHIAVWMARKATLIVPRIMGAAQTVLRGHALLWIVVLEQSLAPPAQSTVSFAKRRANIAVKRS
jgi:hypothetical protein